MNDDRALTVAVPDRVSILTRSLPRTSSVMVHAYGRNGGRSCQVKFVGVRTRRCLDWRYVRKRKKLRRVPVSRPPLMWFPGVSSLRRHPKTVPQRPQLSANRPGMDRRMRDSDSGWDDDHCTRASDGTLSSVPAETLLGFTSGFSW